jgi:rhodanese-related sulfurtransferase
MMEQLNEFVTINWVMILMWFFLAGMIIHSFIKTSNDMSPQQVVQLMSHEKESLIVDVREDNEFQSTHIPDSLHIPLGSLAKRITELDKYKTGHVILSCRSGSRSGRACSLLKKQGFEHVYNLSGGVIAWEKDNLPVNNPRS